MNLKHVHIVIYSIIFYVIYYSNNFYVELIKNSIFKSLENIYNLTNISTQPDLHDGSKIYTPEELSKFSNLQNGLYLSILGKIYDVTTGAKFYGPGGPYNGFVGRDASLAFITGDFNENGLTDDISNLSYKQVMQLETWVDFFNEKYTYKGKLLGRYYDEYGYQTDEYKKFIEKSKQEKIKEEERNAVFPPCNIEWIKNEGTRVWCTKNSGGISRNWIGVPRILLDKKNSKKNRCVCININSKEYDLNKNNIGNYEKCDEYATDCIIKNP